MVPVLGLFGGLLGLFGKIGVRGTGVCGYGRVLNDPDSLALHAVRGTLWLPATAERRGRETSRDTDKSE